MTPRAKNRLNLAATMTAATTVFAALGLLANGVISLNQKLGGTVSLSDSLVYNDSTLFAQDSLLWREVRAINRALGRKTGGSRAGRPATPQEDVGIVRRVWRLLF